jgi:hypothetical protein
MGKNRKTWYIHINNILPEFDTTIKGETWRRKQHNNTREGHKTDKTKQNNATLP